MTLQEEDWLGETSLPAPDTQPDEHVREHIVIGPPGCGKTTYLARQARDVAAAKYGPEHICITSLTRAAATEVAGRDTGIPARNVGTLHSFAYRALDRPAIVETAEGLTAWNNWVGVGAWRIDNKYAVDPENASSEMAISDDAGVKLMQRMGVLRQRMTDRRLWPADVQHFAQRWETFKEEKGYLDFTDLIAVALNDCDVMPGEPDVIMADEAQDMSRLEAALLRKWAWKAKQLVVVGDPDQALYTWRGADPDAIFGTDISRVIVRGQGYRCPAAVVDTALEWIQQIPGRLPTTYKPREDDGVVAQGELHQRSDINARDPHRVVDLATSRPGTAMILATCAYMLQPITGRLKELGVPYHNPYRTSNGAWNPLRAAHRLEAFLVPTWAPERMWTWKELRAFTDPMQAKGNLKRGAKSAIEAMTGPRGRFDDNIGNKPVALSDLVEIFEPDALDRILATDVDWWQSVLLHTKAKTQNYPITTWRRHGIAALQTEPGLVVGTIHSVKGAQAEHVYLLPDLSTAAYWEWRRPGAGRDSVTRQMYVGMTRASETLTLLGPSGPHHVTWTRGKTVG